MAAELDALKGLVDELSSALADLVLAAQEGQANTGEISTTLAEMLELARAAKDKPAQEVPAPQVNVTVQPAAVTVMPALGGDFEITHTYDGDGRIQRSHVRRISTKE
jgi:CO dehydrogenase/acetyl-CoA synthase gamma subunit (corrinoid Fe-S protein)